MSDNTKMVRVQELDFQVRDGGDQQPALVFLHYWGGTGRTWGLVIRELADRHRCVAPDLRGWGCRHHNGDIENSLGPTIAASQEGRAMGITHAKYKAAVVQAAPVWIDLEATVAKTIRYIEEAAKEGAKLIAFPETWIPGYPWYIWVGTPAWAIGKGFVQRYFDNSLSYDSPLAQKIADAAQDNKITVVLGLSERDGGSLYICQWLIGPDGETIAKRRK